MYKAIVLDLDGTLINTEIISYQIYHAMLKEYGINFTKKEYCENYSGKPGTLNAKNMIELYKLPISVEQYLQDEVKKEYEIFNTKGVALKKGARKLIRYLQKNGYRIGLATSSTRPRLELILSQHKLLDVFEVIICADDITHSKPHPEIFLKAQQALNLEAKDILIIEDSEAGVECSYNAKMDVCLIPDIKVPGEKYLKLATYQTNDLAEVIDLLK